MRVNKFMPNANYEILGGLKIKDGLFLGDQYAAQDLEFIITNKITHIINCAGKQIPNHWLSLGINYVTYNWLDVDNQVIFDPKDEIMNQSYKFIEDTLNKGESVLVQSVKGHNRSVCIIAAYLMKKFRWTLYKTLEYLHSRRPDLEMNANFFNQLMNLEVRLTKLGFAPKTYNWDEVGDDIKNYDSEELLIRNTYLNSKNLGVAEFKDIPDKYVKTKISWIDNNSNEKSRLTTILIPNYDEIDFNLREKMNQSKSLLFRSILKGSSKQFENLSKIPQKKKLEKVKSSSILKKLENDVEFYSENNIPLQTDEERKNEISEILKKQKNVVIKKNSDQKFILSFNKNLNTKMNAKTSSQKELTTISEITNDITKKNNTNFNMNSIQKPLIMEHNQNEEKLSNVISKQIKREIDQYKIEDETPQNRMNYNYNVQVLSNKDFKIKNVEKPSKAATLQEKKDLLFMTYDMPQSKGHNRYENPIVKNSFVKKFKKQKRKNNENQDVFKKAEYNEIPSANPLIENSLKYSQKIYSNKFPQYNNFLITNNTKQGPNTKISVNETTDYFNYSNGFTSNYIRNHPPGYDNNLDKDFTIKNLMAPNRPSTAPIKKDRENIPDKFYSNVNMNGFNSLPKENIKRTNIRQNSAQPSNRENENENTKTKANIRIGSPATFSSPAISYQPPIFFSLKPKWKF